MPSVTAATVVAACLSGLATTTTAFIVPAARFDVPPAAVSWKSCGSFHAAALRMSSEQAGGPSDAGEEKPFVLPRCVLCVSSGREILGSRESGGCQVVWCCTGAARSGDGVESFMRMIILSPIILAIALYGRAGQERAPV